MSYIGNQVTSVPFITNIFSGDNSTVRFGPMDRIPASSASVMVFIAGVYKTPSVDYTLDSDYINFTVAPGVGSSNIVIHHMGNGVMATQVPADGTVTGAKISANSVRGNNIVAGQITGNLIADTAVASNNIVVGAITGNLIGIGAISGNNIGTGAISANNFAGGGITSNVLSSNLSISVTRILETANLFTDVSVPPRGNLNIDISNNSLYLFTANTTANVTFNLRGNSVNTFDSTVNVGQTISVAIGLHHNTNATFGGRHAANVFIDGGLISTNRTDPSSGNIIYYAGNTVPALLPPGTLAGQNGQGLEFNLFAITVFKRAANTYTVVQANTLYGLGY